MALYVTFYSCNESLKMYKSMMDYRTFITTENHSPWVFDTIIYTKIVLMKLLLTHSSIV